MASDVKIEANIFANAGILLGTTEGLTKAAILVSNEAKEIAPKKSRRLANSIMYQVEGITDGGFNDGSGEKARTQDRLTTSPRKGEAYVGTNLEYAPYQEYGTRFQRGRAFLRPAMQIILQPGNALQIVASYVRKMEQAFQRRRKVRK
jgi:HK97 gp10 family phage protein